MECSPLSCEVGPALQEGLPAGSIYMALDGSRGLFSQPDTTQTSAAQAPVFLSSTLAKQPQVEMEPSSRAAHSMGEVKPHGAEGSWLGLEHVQAREDW